MSNARENAIKVGTCNFVTVSFLRAGEWEISIDVFDFFRRGATLAKDPDQIYSTTTCTP